MRTEQIYEINIHVPLKSVKGVHRLLPNGLSPPLVAISPPSLSRIHPLVWPAPLATISLQGLAQSHVARAKSIGLKLARSYFRRSGASNEYSPVPIGPAVRAPESKMLGQTGLHTYKHRPDYFFQQSSRGNLQAKAFSTNALKY